MNRPWGRDVQQGWKPARSFTVQLGRIGSLVLLAALALSACSSNKHHAAAPPSPTAAATRWWSNAAVSAGSTINPAQPSAAAASLTQSRSDYCAMLSQTKAVGKSLLSSATSTNPTLVTQTRALVAEIQAVAPSNVVPAWQVIGPVILQAAQSGSLPSGAATTGTTSLQAAEAINDDAKANCHLDLSSLVTGG